MPDPIDVLRTATRLRRIAKQKLFRHQGGNFWGTSPDRCTIIPADILRAMLDCGAAESTGPKSFRMKSGEL